MGKLRHQACPGSVDGKRQACPGHKHRPPSEPFLATPQSPQPHSTGALFPTKLARMLWEKSETHLRKCSADKVLFSLSGIQFLFSQAFPGQGEALVQLQGLHLHGSNGLRFPSLQPLPGLTTGPEPGLGNFPKTQGSWDPCPA